VKLIDSSCWVHPGVSSGAGDLLIAACARIHGAELEYADADFDLLNSL
jgi:predicted nucleic acid-binding protein